MVVFFDFFGVFSYNYFITILLARVKQNNVLVVCVQIYS